MRIGLTTIYIDDQDHAERFYTDTSSASRSRPAPPMVLPKAG